MTHWDKNDKLNGKFASDKFQAVQYVRERLTHSRAVRYARKGTTTYYYYYCRAHAVYRIGFDVHVYTYTDLTYEHHNRRLLVVRQIERIDFVCCKTFTWSRARPQYRLRAHITECLVVVLFCNVPSNRHRQHVRVLLRVPYLIPRRIFPSVR